MEFYICYYTKQNVDGGLVCTGIGISVMLFFTRRALFGFIPTLLLSNVVDAVPSVAALSRSREGRINLGLKGITYYSPFYPFLNVWKCGAHLQVTANRKNYWSDIPPGAKDSPWNQFLDPNGELVKPLPAGTSHLRRIFYSPPIDGIPEGFNRVGQRWILKWDGTATKVSVAGSPITSRGRNRIVWTWGSNTRKIWVAFAGMAHDNPPRNIRLCEARYEPRLDAGEIFNPEWLSIVREGSGIVRFMDWQWTNLNRSTLYFSDIPTEKYYSFGGKTTTPFVKGGMPLPVMSTLAKEVHSHPWVCIPSVLGTRNLSAITTIQNSNPAVVSSPGHKWRDGDQIIPYRTGC
jgi:hypothetical protein